MKSDFLEPDELASVGFASIGIDVRLSRHALVFAPDRVTIGDHTRIDAFTILAAGVGGIRLGKHIHMSTYSAIFGQAGVDIGDFVGVSPRTTILTSIVDGIDSRSGDARFRHPGRVVQAAVRIGGHAALGTGCVILPGVEVGASAAVGAFSLVERNVPEFAIVAGAPIRRIGTRSSAHRELAARMLDQKADPRCR